MIAVKNIIAITLLFIVSTSNAQDRFYTKTGKIDFFSSASLEDIEAKNKTVTAVLDKKIGAIQFSVQIKGFEFEKDQMQKHFNETYLESDKYPKSDFKGTITNNSAVTYTKDGTYKVKVKGRLTLHGVTKDIETPATLKIANGKIDASSTFNILLSDYKITIPSLMKEKVSNSIKITVTINLEPVKSKVF